MRDFARRAVALGLSWVFAATTVWAGAPPVVVSPAGPLPSMRTFLIGAAFEGPGWETAGDSRTDDDERNDDRKDGNKKESKNKDGNKKDDNKKDDGRKDDDKDRDDKGRDRDKKHGGGKDRDDRRHGDLDCCDRDGHGRWDRDDRERDDHHGHRGSQCSCDTSFFGPKRYTRSSGAPNVFVDTISVPASVRSPYILKVQNGEPDGSHRVSSATIEIGGKTVAEPDDFSQHVSGFNRKVSLTQQTTLEVRLTSKPGSWLTISLCGQGQPDTTPPQLTWTEPGPLVGSATPHLALRYEDVPGPDEPSASGIDTGTLVVTLDGVDVSALFTRQPADASADVPAGAALLDGLHQLKATIRDTAGNSASADTAFRVDTLPPELVVDSPKANGYVNASPALVSGTLADADPQAAVECRVGSVSVPGTRSGPGPQASYTCAPPLDEGPNTVEVIAHDWLAHTTTLPIPVTLDTRQPVVTIDTPQDGSWTGLDAINVTGHVEDASPTKAVTVNGVAAALTGAMFTASDVPVGAGRITARAEDAAGNTGETAIDLRFDRNPPTVTITSPGRDTWVLGPHVEVAGSVTDAEGSAVVVEVNGRMETDPLPIVPRSFHAVVDAGEGPLELVATARDEAGNAGVSLPHPVNVDYTAPVITLTEPADVPVTNATSLHLVGTVVDISPTTLTVGGTSVEVLPDGSFTADVPLPDEGEREIVLVATDSVGLVGTLDQPVIVDRTLPEVAILSPGEGDYVLSLPVVVEGTVTDGPAGLPVPPPTLTVDGQSATVTGQAWTITFDALLDGPHAFTARARDAAGNDSVPAVRHVILDLAPPTVTISDPAQPLLTREGAISVRGTVDGRAPLSVDVSGVAAIVTGSTWEALVPLNEGDNTISAVAKSASGRESAPASVMVTRDSIAPQVLELQTPESIGRDEPGRGRVDAADNLPGVVVEVRIDGTAVGPASPPPYEFDIAAPPAAPDGATVEVTAIATDQAGNVSSPLSRSVSIASAGVVIGQVLSDETGLPIPEATVVLETPSGPKTAESDERGGYSFPTSGAVARLRAGMAGMISVEREVSVASGVGTVVLDSRLTTLGEPVVVDSGGLALPKLELPGPIPVALVLNVPMNAVTQPTSFRLTPLSAQGLPGLLPLGWSPVAAFDVRADAPVGPGLEAALEGIPDATLHLVRFDTGSRAWRMVEPGLVPASGAQTVALAGTGAYALVAPDADPAPALPAPGEVLPGVAQADLPPAAVGQAAVEPAVLPPSGGTAAGRLFVQSETPLPSGTVVQAKVTEEFELASGKTASAEVRRQDILLFRAPLPADAPQPVAGETVLHAVLPVAPSRTFETADLVRGRVHLDVLAGRESVRGQTGGNKELTLQSGGAALSVPAASLAEDTVVDVQESALSSFLPAASDLEPLGEVVVDFTGALLATSAGLSIEGEALAGETLLVARVERVLGIPRLLVVALAEASGGRIAAVPVAGLPGIKQGGRYVFYRLSQPVGWVSGPTTLASTGAPVGGAVVESDGLPFVGRSGLGVPYLLVARSGLAQVSATVPGTRLVASGSATVTEGGPAEAAPLPLAFAGAVTTATIAPADGTLGVAVSVQVVVEATAALDPSAGNLAKAKLFKGSEPVEVRLLLSTSGRRLAVIPVKPLEVSTDYTFTAAGLKDTANEDVLVGAPVSFRTKDFVPPVFDVDAIVLSYPEGGTTKVTAPKGSLPPFSEVLILNATSGAVLWLQVDNEGCIGCIPGTNELPATIDDRLMITITDPQGNVVTFERSKFVKPDGTVAIGPGGGTVEGPGGVELRIPTGALEKGVELKVEGLTAEALLQEFPGQLPDLGKNDQGEPRGHLAGGLKITSKDQPSFTKPIDLAFPVPDFTAVPEAQRPPADKPEEAYFYVVRRLEGPCEDGSDTCAAEDRKVLFQSIDHAFLECPGGETTCDASEKKVVTASWPFGGYVDSFGGYAYPSAFLLIQPVAVAYSYLMWTYAQGQPGQALAGVVTGKVLRTKWNPGATVPQYEGVAGALVTAVDGSGQRLLTGEEAAAVTGTDGTFTLWDPRYVGGTVRVAATLPGVTGDVNTLCPPGDGGDASFRCGTAYEADPADFKTTGLRFHQNIATVNLTFPAVAPPPPPPAIGVTVYRTVDGKRVDTRGIVPAGTPLILGVKPSTSAVDVREVLIQGAAQSFRADPLKGQPTGADWIVEYTPANVGTYRVELTGLGANAQGLPEAVKGGTTFRVIGAAGTDEIVDGQAPEVIPARTVPKTGATGVQASSFVSVVFTEPVRKISGNVVLKDPKGQPVAVKLSGVPRFGGEPVEDLDASPDAVVTSLTVQPLSGLEYGATYRLELGAGIEDLDATPRGLVPYATSFTTFTPESLSQNPESFGSPGIVVLGERAYLVQNHFYSGTLRVFETTDPVTPLEIPNSDADSRDPRFVVSYRPVDVVGESDSPLTGGRVVAVVTGPTAQSKPSNVWLLDVNDDAETKWIGAVSLTNSAGDGFVNRSFLRAGVLYAATFRKGIQVVDLGQVKDAFKAPGTAAFFTMSQAFLTDGRGFGQENVINIPVSSPFGGPARLNDIEAALVQTTDGAQLLVAAPGDPGLTVVNPATQSVLWNDAVTVVRDDGGQPVVEATLRSGQAIAIGNVAGQDLAVVVGSGTILQEAQSRPLLVVVSLFDPQNPVGLGYVLLDDATVGDVILKDDVALLGGSKQVTLVSLADSARPKVLGTAQGVGGRLALGENGSVLFSTERSVFGGTDLPLGGVRTAALGAITVISKIDPNPVVLDAAGTLVEGVRFVYRAIPPQPDLTASSLEFVTGTTVFSQYDAPLDGEGKGSQRISPDLAQPGNVTVQVRLRVEMSDEALTPRPLPKTVLRKAFEVQPAEADAVQLGDVLVLSAVHQGLLDRLDEDPTAPLPKLVWKAPGVLWPAGPDEYGFYSAELPLGGLAGGRGPFALVDDQNRVYARTGDITLLPGWPVSGTLRAESPAQLPADGRSEISLTLEDVRDSAGNIVANDSPVAWQILGDGEGELIGADDSATAGGRATIRYRAAVQPGTVVVRATLDVPGQEWYRDIAVELMTLRGEIQKSSPTDVIFEITSDAGPPADGTPVGWITYRGKVEGWSEVQGGQALAQWTDWPEEYFREGARRDRFVYVGATVGRFRQGLLLDTAELAAFPPGPHVLLDSDRLVMGTYGQPQTSFAAFQAAAPEPSTAFASTTTARVRGGLPGGTVRLALGTTLSPAVEPIAAYPLDVLEDNIATPQEDDHVTSDIYGGLAATVGEGVSIDQSEPLHQPGALRVVATSSASALRIDDPAVLALASDFGFNGWVRFDGVDPGQKLLERSGAYGLEVIRDAGESWLEFYVMSGAERRVVRSRIALEPQRWYQFAAHARDGRLQLALSADTTVALGDSVSTVDPSVAPLRIGVGFNGLIDELAVYDFRVAPNVLFANGATEIDVPLDENGEGSAEVQVVAEAPAPIALQSGLPSGARAFYAVATQAADISSLPDDAFARRLRQVPVRVYEAPGPNERPESQWAAFKLELGPSIANCLEGIGTGEGDFISQQTACDIFAGLIPGTNAIFAFRDLYFAGMNFVDGKQTASDYIKGSFALINLAIEAIPAARSLGTAFSKARLALKGKSAELLIAREAAAKVRRLVADPAADAAESAVVKILTEGDDEARDALLYFLDDAVLGADTLVPATTLMAAGGGMRGLMASPPAVTILAALPLPSPFGREVTEALFGFLDNLGVAGGKSDDFLKALRKAAAKDPALGREVASRMVSQLRHLAGGLGGHTLTLSDEAVEGLALFMKHTISKRRLQKMWQELVDPKYVGMSADAGQKAMERFFVNVKKLNDVLPKTGEAAQWFHNLLARGAGTSRTFRSTSGAYHALERTLAQLEAHPTAVVQALDSALEDFAGRPDLVLKIGDEIWQFEFKRLSRLLKGTEISQLHATVEAAFKRIAADPRYPTKALRLEALKEALGRIVYEFPKDAKGLEGALTSQLRGEAASKLRSWAKDAAEGIKLTFEGAFP